MFNRQVGKGDNRRPTDEKKVAENWPADMGPKDGKVKRFKKVYGAPKTQTSNLNLVGLERKGEPKVIYQDLLADWRKEND